MIPAFFDPYDDGMKPAHPLSPSTPSGAWTHSLNGALALRKTAARAQTAAVMERFAGCMVK